MGVGSLSYGTCTPQGEPNGIVQVKNETALVGMSGSGPGAVIYAYPVDSCGVVQSNSQTRLIAPVNNETNSTTQASIATFNGWIAIYSGPIGQPGSSQLCSPNQYGFTAAAGTNPSQNNNDGYVRVLNATNPPGVCGVDE